MTDNHDSSTPEGRIAETIRATVIEGPVIHKMPMAFNPWQALMLARGLQLACRTPFLPDQVQAFYHTITEVIVSMLGHLDAGEEMQQLLRAGWSHAEVAPLHQISQGMPLSIVDGVGPDRCGFITAEQRRCDRPFDQTDPVVWDMTRGCWLRAACQHLAEQCHCAICAAEARS